LASLLEIKNLSHVYSAGTPFQHAALHDVSLCIERGEFIGLIGHTGSGKSTLIQHLNGLLKPTSGKVLFQGEDIWKDVKFTRETRYHVGLVFQYPEYQLFEETVYKDIAFGPKNMGLSEEEIRARVLRAAGFVGIAESELEKSPFDLSGGQKRRVAIAGVIAMEPEVLILDEPTAGLDPAGRESILQNIRDYQKAQNATVIMVSHSMEEIASNVSRLVVMNDGAVVMTGSPREVFANAQELMAIGLDVPQVTRVFLRLREMGLDVDTSVFTVEQALAAAEQALPQTASYRLCDYLLLPKAEEPLLTEYEQLVLRRGCGRTAARLLCAEGETGHLAAQAALPDALMAQIKAAAPTAPRLYQHTEPGLLPILRWNAEEITIQEGGVLHTVAGDTPLSSEQAEVYRLLTGQGGTRQLWLEGKRIGIRRCTVSVTLQKAQVLVRLDCQRAAHSPLPTQAQRQQLAAQCTTLLQSCWQQGVDVLHLQARAVLRSGSIAGFDPTKNACPQWRTDVHFMPY
jgi:energy-coupling factor transporter ATPase